MRVRRRLGFIAAGLAFIAVGAILIYAGFTTAPGEAAVRIPRREDWSAMEAKVIGLCSIVLGVYVIGWLARAKH